ERHPRPSWHRLAQPQARLRRLLRRAPTQISGRDAAGSYALQAPRARRRDARMQEGAARRHGAASPKAPSPASGKRASPPDASARATPVGETVRRPRERTALAYGLTNG